MRVYHRTSEAAGLAALRDRRLVSKEHPPSVYVSSERVGDAATGYGAFVVELDVPDELLMLDDEFPDGEQHFRVLLADMRPEFIRGGGLG